LYAKLLTCLEGTALQSIVARSHLHSDGLQYLQDLTATHRPLHVPEIIAAKTVQFWGSTRRMSTETVDAYYNRFKELLNEIQDADGPIPTKNAMRHFIFTLGSEFEPIQHNYRMDNLPSKWQTKNWPELLDCVITSFFLSSQMDFKRKITTLLMAIAIVSLIKRKYASGFFIQLSSAERLQLLKNVILTNAFIISLLAMLLLIVT
jgi:hypothetical protein